MTKNYTTKTASLRATVIDSRNVDAKKISIDGKNLLDYIDEKETIVKDERDLITENDIWGTKVIKDENDNVIVTHDFITIPTDNESPWKKQVTKIEDNKAYIGDEFYANVQTDMIKDGNNLFVNNKTLKTFHSDLTSMTNGSVTFAASSLESFEGNTSSLTNGRYMFQFCYDLTNVECDLSNLTNGVNMFSDCGELKDVSKIGKLKSLEIATQMFCGTNVDAKGNGPFTEMPSLKFASAMFARDTSLTSFTSNTPILTNIDGMFCVCENLESVVLTTDNVTSASLAFQSCYSLKSFECKLHSLISAQSMFEDCCELEKFENSLQSLVKGDAMFGGCEKLSTFKVDNLDMLVEGGAMLCYCNIEEFNYDLPSLEDGSYMFRDTPLKTFTSSLPSLLAGYYMFKGCKLDKNSILMIADSIKNLEESGHAIKNGNSWNYAEDVDMWRTSLIRAMISEPYRGVLHITFDSEGLTESDINEIKEYCQEIANKGWKVYVTGGDMKDTVISPASTLSLDDETNTNTPIPFFAKPINVSEEEAEYTDNNGNYYVINGGQYIFGDDISSYGMFLNIEDAALNMGLTKIEKKSKYK